MNYQSAASASALSTEDLDTQVIAQKMIIQALYKAQSVFKPISTVLRFFKPTCQPAFPRCGIEIIGAITELPPRPTISIPLHLKEETPKRSGQLR